MPHAQASTTGPAHAHAQACAQESAGGHGPVPGPVSGPVELSDGSVTVRGTQHSYSEICRGTGLSLSHVSRIFNGLRMPSAKSLSSIAEFMGVDMADLYAQLASLRRAS